MKTGGLVRWDELETAELVPGASHHFVRTLARENAWSADHARRVLREYKRFLWLAATATHSVTPSDAVDQAWHLHIISTAEYRRFCTKHFGRWIEHAPSRGEHDERARFERDYQRTLEAYQRVFGEAAPSNVWPDAARRFAPDLHFARVNLATHWALPKPAWLVGWIRRPDRLVSGRALLLGAGAGLVTIGCAASTRGSDPTNMSGPDFLILYCALWGVSLLAATAFQRGWLARAVPRPLPELDPYEVAELAERGRGLDVALANLLALRRIEFDDELRTFRAVAPLSPGTNRYETRVYEAIASAPGSSLSELRRSLQDATTELHERLQAAGLATAKPSRLALWLALLAPGVGVMRLWTRAGTHYPVVWLLVLCALGALVAFAWFRRGSYRTTGGHAVLRELQRRHMDLRAPITNEEVAGFTGLPMAVGLFGTGLLVAPAFQGCFRERGRAPAHGACGSGCGDAGGDGSDGGGGDGGGDGGGGCGGCGGCGGGGGD